MSNVIIYGDELYHHGVKGMKWGVRRYQNQDGSLTTLGKKARETYDRYKNIKDKIPNPREVPKKSESFTERPTKKSESFTERPGQRINNSSFDEQSHIPGIKTHIRIPNSINSNSSTTKNEPSDRKGLSEGQKKAIKTGAIIAGAALATYGAYKLSKNYMFSQDSKAFKTAEEYIRNNRMRKVGESVFEDGSREVMYRNYANTIAATLKDNTAADRRAQQRYIDNIDNEVYKKAAAIEDNIRNKTGYKVAKKINDTGDYVRNTIKDTKKSINNAKRNIVETYKNISSDNSKSSAYKSRNYDINKAKSAVAAARKNNGPRSVASTMNARPRRKNNGPRSVANAMNTRRR